MAVLTSYFCFICSSSWSYSKVLSSCSAHSKPLELRSNLHLTFARVSFLLCFVICLVIVKFTLSIPFTRFIFPLTISPSLSLSLPPLLSHWPLSISSILSTTYAYPSLPSQLYYYYIRHAFMQFESRSKYPHLLSVHARGLICF